MPVQTPTVSSSALLQPCPDLRQISGITSRPSFADVLQTETATLSYRFQRGRIEDPSSPRPAGHEVALLSTIVVGAHESPLSLTRRAFTIRLFSHPSPPRICFYPSQDEVGHVRLWNSLIISGAVSRPPCLPNHLGQSMSAFVLRDGRASEHDGWALLLICVSDSGLLTTARRLLRWDLRPAGQSHSEWHQSSLGLTIFTGNEGTHICPCLPILLDWKPHRGNSPSREAQLRSRGPMPARMASTCSSSSQLWFHAIAY